ncbi:MAG: hypothetical protein SFT91_00290 [Rickettsiaceae bacterium]|nr:hypothetical protein [Rickettsiaceae bacterium]
MRLKNLSCFCFVVFFGLNSFASSATRVNPKSDKTPTANQIRELRDANLNSVDGRARKLLETPNLPNINNQ